MEPGLVLGFAIAVVVLNVVPGPGMMFIVAHGITGGRRAGIVAAAGMASGTVVHTALAALGLSALIRSAPTALHAIRVGGACFLVYLAVKTLRSASRDAQAASRDLHPSLRRTYASAVLTNLANPKVIAFYLAFVPQFLTDGGWPIAGQIAVLGAVITVIGLLMDCLVGVAAGAFSDLLQARPSIQRSLKRVSAAVFGGLAVRMITQTD